MRLNITGHPDELAKADTRLIEELAEQILPYNPVLSATLLKAAREPLRTNLRSKVLQGLREASVERYGAQMSSMLEEIDAVLRANLEKSRAVEDPLGYPMIMDMTKAKAATPIGGLTPGGSRVSLVNGERVYTKEETPKRKSTKVDREAAEKARIAAIPRVSDEEASDALTMMGEWLRSLDDVREINNAGMNKLDFQRWRDDLSLDSKRRMLKKYRRQLVNQFGETAFYETGVADPPKAGEGVESHWRWHQTFGNFNFRVVMKYGDKRFWPVQNYVKSHGLFASKDRDTGTWWYVLKDHVGFDWPAFKAGLEEVLGDKTDLPEELPEPPTAKEQIEETIDTSEDGKGSFKQVTEMIRSRRGDGMMAVKWRPDDDSYEFVFPPGPISTLFSNKAGRIPGVTQWNSDVNPWTVRVFDHHVAKVAIERAEKTVNGLRVVRENWEAAERKEIDREAELQKPIPEVAKRLNPAFKLFSYQNEGVRFLLGRDGTAMLGDEMGCIEGDAVVTINRAGKGQQITLADLYDKHTGESRWDRSIPTYIRSLCDGEFRRNMIINVLDKGVRPVLRVTLSDGKVLRLTPDHEVAQPGGVYRPIECLRPGDAVLVNGQRACETCGGTNDLIPKEAEIVSIETAGETRVFDVVCADPHRNFVANGIVVHNCGKTLQWMSYIAASPKQHKSVVIAPKNVRRQWLTEAAKFFPGFFVGKELDSAELLKIKRKVGVKAKDIGTPEQVDQIVKALNLQNTNLTTVNYESVVKFAPYLKAAGFNTMNMDESHRMKNPTAKVTKAILDLANNMEHKTLMSGTAIKNSRDEFFTQFQIVQPGLFKQAKDIKGTRIGDLWDTMRPFYLARQKAKVLKDLPPKLTTIAQIPAAKEYQPDLASTLEDVVHNASARRYVEALKNGESVESAKILAGEEADEMRIAIAEAIEAINNGEDMGDGRGSAEDQALRMFIKKDIAEFSRTRHALAYAKADSTAGFVKDALTDSDGNFLVFTESVITAERIVSILGSVDEGGVAELFTGKIPNDKREAIKAKFSPDTRKDNETSRVIVATRPTLAEGANLTSIDKVVFNDLPWNPGTIRQAEDRTHRTGQVNPVNVYWIEAEKNNMDALVTGLIHRKADMHKKSLEGSQFSPEELEWKDAPVKLEDLIGDLQGQDPVPAEAPVAASEQNDAPKPATPTDSAKVRDATKTPPKEDEGGQYRMFSDKRLTLDLMKAQVESSDAGGDDPDYSEDGELILDPKTNLTPSETAEEKKKKAESGETDDDDDDDAEKSMGPLGRLIKGEKHKYIKRIATGNPKRPWRYIYSVGSKYAGADVTTGEKIKINSGDQAGHYEVTDSHPNGWVTLRHDETGEQLSMKQSQLQAVFAKQHAPEIQEKRRKLNEIVKKANQHGTPKIIARAERAVEAFNQRFPDAMADALRARAKEYDRDHRDQQGHAVAAIAHVVAATDATNRQAVESLNRAKQHLPKKRGRKAGGLAMGKKAESYDVLLESLGGDVPANFMEADQRYRAFKGEVDPLVGQSRTRPQPYTGGELDAANAALNLSAPTRGEARNRSAGKDRRVSCPREAWDRLTAGATGWDDPRVLAAVETMRGVSGFSAVKLPDRINDAILDKAHRAYERAQAEAERTRLAIAKAQAEADARESAAERKAIQSESGDDSFNPDDF